MLKFEQIYNKIIVKFRYQQVKMRLDFTLLIWAQLFKALI